MSTSTRSTSYRPDINGLRAWAVMAVLLFHFGIFGFDAGFIGVDVFFVISGFLMASIIVKGLENSFFSLWSFYLSRIRRIAPALMALITVLLVLGWFWLPTPDYKALGAQSAYGLSFLSNIYYWRSAGYFDAAAHEKWLLHIWSLGVEFQFYLLFPISLLILWKIKPSIKVLVYGLVFAFFASLLLSIIATSWKPTPAFYLLPTRGWELIAGGLVFMASRNMSELTRYSTALFWSGAGLLVVSMLFIDKSLAWPSGWALLPVTGTVCILLAKSDSWLVSHPVAQWFGDRSYSLYLWHWPFVVALYFAGLQNEWPWVAGALLLSVGFGHFSYVLVETPTRRFLTAASMFKQIVVLGAVGLIIGLAAVSVRLFVFDGRLPKAVEIAAAETVNNDPRREECFNSATEKGAVGCVYGHSDIGAILMGDSHSASTITSFGHAANSIGKGVIFWGMTSCPTLENIKYSSRVERPKNICSDFNNWAFNQLGKYNNLPLILVSRTSSYLMGPNEPDRVKESKLTSIYFTTPYVYRDEDGYIEEFQDVIVSTACRLSEDRPVYLMRPVPEYGISIPQTLSKNILFGRGDEDIKITLESYHQRNKLVWEAQDLAAEQCGVKILNPLPYLCDDEFCYGSRDGRPLYYDDDHLSEYGNKFLVPMFEQVFKDQK